MNESYWVIGGEFRDTGFTELVAGTERVFGPYPDREQALRAWRNLATETRSMCLARFMVVHEGASAAAA